MEDIVQKDDFIKRNYIYANVRDKLGNYSNVEQLIACMLLYNSQSANLRIVAEEMESFKILSYSNYNKLIDELLDQNMYSIYDNFINYNLEFKDKFFSIYNFYKLGKNRQHELSSRYNIPEERSTLTKVINNLKTLDSTIIQPIVNYYNENFKFKRSLEIEIKYLDETEVNTLIEYGYATRFKFNFIESQRVIDLIREGNLNINFSLCYLTYDDYIFIAIPSIYETFDTGTELKKIIL